MCVVAAAYGMGGGVSPRGHVVGASMGESVGDREGESVGRICVWTGERGRSYSSASWYIWWISNSASPGDSASGSDGGNSRLGGERVM